MKDLTGGSVAGTILAMAIPVAASMLFQTLYLLVDLYFVAALGEDAVAGVGTAATLLFMVSALTQVLGVAAVAMISQSVGRKDRASANLVFNQTAVLSGFCAVATLIVGYLFADDYLATVAADAGAYREGVIFINWFLPGLALQFPIIAMASSLRGTGIVKPAMVIQVSTVLLNILLAPVLIAGWGPGPALGVMGAALATTLASVFGLILLIAYFIKLEKYVAFDASQCRPRLDLWGRMLNIGLPAGGEMLLLFVYFSAVYYLIQDFGATAQAGFSIGGRVMQSIFMPTMAIAFAMGPIVGQCFGAGNYPRVRETYFKGILLSSLVMLTVTLILQLSPELVVGVFSDQEEVVAIAAVFLQIVSLNFITQGIVFSSSGVFQGLGNTRPALVSSLLRIGIFLPLAIWASSRPDYRIEHIWYISVLSVVLQCLFSVWLVMREFRLRLGSSVAGPDAQPSATQADQSSVQQSS